MDTVYCAVQCTYYCILFSLTPTPQESQKVLKLTLKIIIKKIILNELTVIRTIMQRFT